MAQHVAAQEWCIDASRFGVLEDDVANGGPAGQWFERHLRSQKDMAGVRVAWPPIAEITSQGLGDGWQQRQGERHASLGPHELERGGTPVDVVYRKPDRFTGAAAIDTHHQQKSVVARAIACRGVNCL